MKTVNWSVDTFPRLKAFCEDNYILFKLYVTPNYIPATLEGRKLEFVFEKKSKPKYVVTDYEYGGCLLMVLSECEDDLIAALKEHFGIKEAEE